MVFTYKHWELFCRKLRENGLCSIPAKEVTGEMAGYLVLKHDVETDVRKAYKIAEIEQKYGHRGSFYVQVYLLQDAGNVELLKKMQQMGHEISYHYDVLDSCKGDMIAAMGQFEENREVFENHGFPVTTVCQHGNPVIERKGYHSNRDFFRSRQVQTQYPNIADIMVNFKSSRETDYLYFSDAGRRFQMIYDPINNDINGSDDKNIPYEDLECLYQALDRNNGNIISIHPHRWMASAGGYLLKTWLFRSIKAVAKILLKVPVFKRIMGRYYYLAKKI